METLASGQGWLAPIKKWRESSSVGVIDSAAHICLAVLTLLTPHHIIQSLFWNCRYLATDLYVTGWAVVALVLLGWAPTGSNASTAISIFVVWRLAEALSRELWIILYRGTRLTATSRVLMIALLNYGTITGLFGYLYHQGKVGLMKAAWISLSFSPPEPLKAGSLEVVQSAYCLLFIIIVFASFVARVHLIDDSAQNR